MLGKRFLAVLVSVAVLVLGGAALRGADAAPPERGGDEAVVPTVRGDMVVATSAGRFARVGLVPAPAGAPADHEYPVGFLGLTVKQLPRGGETTLTLHLPAGVDAPVAMKCVPAGCAPHPASHDGSTLRLTLRDGGAGDADGLANGRIVDPLAPARPAGPACPLQPGDNVVHRWEGTVPAAVLGITVAQPAGVTEAFEVPAGCELLEVRVRVEWDLFAEDVDLAVVGPGGEERTAETANVLTGQAHEVVAFDDDPAAGTYTAEVHGYLAAETPFRATATVAVPAAPTADQDLDGVVDAEDGCPTVYDPSQADGDGDGVGDACDAPHPAIPLDTPTRVFEARGRSGLTIQPPPIGPAASLQGTGHTVGGRLEHRYALTLSSHHQDYSALVVRLQWPAPFADYLTLDVRSPSGTVASSIFVNTSYQEVRVPSPVPGEYTLVVRESRTTGAEFALTGDVTRTAAPDFGPVPPVVSDPARPRVVVAVLDSAVNPYHDFFYAGSTAYPHGHPSAVTQEVLDALGVPSENVVALTRTGNLAADVAADAGFWSRVRRGERYHFLGTNLVATSFSPEGQVPLRPDTSKSPHGLGTSAAALTANPDAVLLFVEQGSAIGSEPSHAFAFRHPHVDVVSTSYGVQVPEVGFPLPEHRAFRHSREGVVDGGKLHFSSAGNGPGVTPLRAGAGPWWSIGVSGVEEGGSEGDSLLSGTFPDFVSDFTQDLPYCMDCEREVETGVPGTSFATPRAAGVASRVIQDARRARGHAGGIAEFDGRMVMVAGAGPPITGWQVRRGLEAAAWVPDSLAYDPVDAVFEVVGVPVNPAAPWLQVGWGDLTAHPDKAVVASALAELGFAGVRREKPAGFCEFQTEVVRARKLYWDQVAPAAPDVPLLGGERPPGPPDEDPFVYC